jgi:hypothetical protein
MGTKYQRFVEEFQDKAIKVALSSSEHAGRPSRIQGIDSFEFELGVKKWDY